MFIKQVVKTRESIRARSVGETMKDIESTLLDLGLEASIVRASLARATRSDLGSSDAEHGILLGTETEKGAILLPAAEKAVELVREALETALA